LGRSQAPLVDHYFEDERVNENFAGKHSDSEGRATDVIGNASEDSDIAGQAKANLTAGQFANGDYRSVLSQAIIWALESHYSMSEQALQNPKVFEEIADLLLPEVYEKARGERSRWSAVSIESIVCFLTLVRIPFVTSP
jgi:hypothetical protein